MYEVNNKDELVFEVKPNTSGHFSRGREIGNYLVEITLTDDDEYEPLSNKYRFWINLYRESDFLPEEEEEIEEIEEIEDQEINDDSWSPPEDNDMDMEEIDNEGYLINWNPWKEQEYEVVDLRKDKPYNPDAPVPRIVSLDQYGLLTIAWDRLMDIPSNLTEIKPENVTVIETDIYQHKIAS